MSETKIQAPDGVPFIDVSRAFDAPRDLVFRAFIEPNLLVQWTSTTSGPAAAGATSTATPTATRLTPPR